MSEISPRIVPVPLADSLSERYLSYALSTITSRSLPDVRDGLKPVHRRLLYAMRALRLDADGGFKKCARVVGDIMEKIGDLLAAKKLPGLADAIDESAEDVRVVLVPRSRAVDAAALMESLFRATELETRIPLNLNVLDARNRPRVMSLRDALQAFLDHRRDVLQRRSRHRLERIARRLEVLGGHLVAYVNLEEVIRIVREEDDPKAVMIARWELTDVQAYGLIRRHAPSEYGPHKTLYNRFVRWSEAGFFNRIFAALAPVSVTPLTEFLR